MDKVEEYLYNAGLPGHHPEDKEYLEHRCYNETTSGIEYDVILEQHKEGSLHKSWTPYEQDMSYYPEVFKKYAENHEAWDKAKKKFDTEDPLEEQADHAFKRKVPKNQDPWEKKYDDFMPRYTGTLWQ